MKPNQNTGSGFLDGLTLESQQEKREKSPRESLEKSTERFHRDVSHKTSEGIHRDASHKTPIGFHRDVSHKTSEEIHRDVSHKTPEGFHRDSSQKTRDVVDSSSVRDFSEFGVTNSKSTKPTASKISSGKPIRPDSQTVSGKKDKATRLMLSRRNQHHRLLAFVFTSVVLVFVVLHLISPDRTYSEAENRNLAQLPAWSLESVTDGSFFSSLDSYIADQFFARDSWMSLKMREDTLLGRREAGGVYLGRDGYLLSQPVVPNETSILRTARSINAFAADHPEIPMVVMVAPGSGVVQPQFLPSNAPIRNQEADIQLIYDQLSASIRLVDVADALRQHAEEYIYYKTDHHWTSLGALYAFRAAASKMGIPDARGEVGEYSVYPVASDFQGTLSSKSGSHQACDVVDIYIPRDCSVSYYVNYVDSGKKSASFFQSAALESKDKYTVFFGGNHPLLTIKTTADNDRALLIFKDSYANSFIPFLYPYYEDIVVIDPRYYYDNLSGLMGNYGITDVLFLYSADTLLVDTALADVLGVG